MDNFYSLKSFVLLPGSAEVPLPKLNNKNIIISHFLVCVFFFFFQGGLSVKLFSHFICLASLCSWTKQWSTMKHKDCIRECWKKLLQGKAGVSSLTSAEAVLQLGIFEDSPP